MNAFQYHKLFPEGGEPTANFEQKFRQQRQTTGSRGRIHKGKCQMDLR
jgi:hypothetical protein